MRSGDTIESTIADLRKSLDELKAGPQFTGRGSIITYRTQSSSPYDMSATLAPSAQQQYRLRLDYNKAVAGAIIVLNIFYRVDNPAVMNDPVERINPSNPNVEVYWEIEEAANTFTSWVVTISSTTAGFGTYTGYAKYFIDGTDTGSVTITAI